MRVFHSLLILICTFAFICLASCDGKLLATFSSRRLGFLNLTVIDPTTTKTCSVLYHNSDLVQIDPVLAAWDSTNRIVYIPAVDPNGGEASYRIIGLALADDLSKATLISNWNIAPFFKVYAVHFDSEANRLVLVGLRTNSQPLYICTLNIPTGDLTWGTHFPVGYLLDGDSREGGATVINKFRNLEVPIIDLFSGTHYLYMISLDSFNGVSYGHTDSVPQAMFIDPTTEAVKAIFSDVTTSKLGFGTIVSGSKYEVKQGWDVKGFVRVDSGLATLDSDNQVFYTLLADSDGVKSALVTADSNTGDIKQVVEWPQQQQSPSSLLFV